MSLAWLIEQPKIIPPKGRVIKVLDIGQTDLRHTNVGRTPFDREQDMRDVLELIKLRPMSRDEVRNVTKFGLRRTQAAILGLQGKTLARYFRNAGKPGGGKWYPVTDGEVVIKL